MPFGIELLSFWLLLMRQPLLILFALQFRISVRVYERVDLLTCLTHRALMRGVRAKSVEVLRIEAGIYGESCAGLGSGEDRAYARYLTAVVFDSVDSTLDRLSRSYRNCKYEHVLALYHRDDVITEEHLRCARGLGSNNVDRLVCVHVDEVVFRELLSETRADYFGTVKAEDGVNDGRVIKVGAQLLCYSLCL